MSDEHPHKPNFRINLEQFVYDRSISFILLWNHRISNTEKNRKE